MLSCKGWKFYQVVSTNLNFNRQQYKDFLTYKTDWKNQQNDK